VLVIRNKEVAIMSTFANRPHLTTRNADDFGPVTPPDVPRIEERANQFTKWIKSGVVREKASAALKYADKHPRQMMVGALALGMLVGALRRGRGRHAGNGF
jgi:hypothetical protein